MYGEEFDPDWKGYFSTLSPDIKERVAKKIRHILDGLPGRHLQHGVDYFVEEVGGYRITYKSFESRMVRRFYFVGTHDEYLRWIGEQERIK